LVAFHFVVGNAGFALLVRLTLSGVPVEPLYFANMIHGFLTMGGAIPAAQTALFRITDAFAALEP
jgi:hypothetical protein